MHQRSAPPPQWAGAPPMGNPGSTTARDCGMIKIRIVTVLEQHRRALVFEGVTSECQIA